MRGRVERFLFLTGVLISLLIASRVLYAEPYGTPVPAGVRPLLRLLAAALVTVLLADGILQLLPGSGRPRRRPILPFLGCAGGLLLLLLPWIGQRVPSLALEPGVGAHLGLTCLVAGTYPLRLLALGFRVGIPRLARRAPLLLPAGILAVILIGCLLLLSPKAAWDGADVGLSEALFTSISAATVTGLTVVDTGGTFTPFGHWVILGLIQLGGLGLMTFFAFAMMALGGGLGVRHGVVLRDLLDQESPGEVRRLLKAVIVATLATEGIGALCLFLVWGPPAGGGDSGPGLFSCLFHSVSAFCNAGFCLYADSFSPWRGAVLVNGVISSLIIAGGLGFTVMRDLWDQALRGRAWLRARGAPALVSDPEPTARPLFSAQSRIVLVTSGALLLGGWLAIWISEASWPHPGEDPLWLSSFFHSVSARTAGFHSFDLAESSPLARFVIILLMLVGASPGSTGGGIKTVSFSLLLLAIAARLQNRDSIEIFHRRIPREALHGSLVVIASALSVLALLVAGLLWSEREALAAGSFSFLELLFEAVSAFGTVGLSLGVTPELSGGGRWVVA
ncbi:MAG: TrkH family potassium uptake protein, partial [Planctomycetota bacterium]